MAMIGQIEQVRDGWRVAFKLNETAARPSCHSPVYATEAELHAAHPDLKQGGELPLDVLPSVAPSAVPSKPAKTRRRR